MRLRRPQGSGRAPGAHLLFRFPAGDHRPHRAPLCSRESTHLKENPVMDWRDKAACLTADPELLFPVGNTGPAVDQIEKAKAVCARCTVTEACLQYALETHQDYGVRSEERRVGKECRSRWSP